MRVAVWVRGARAEASPRSGAPDLTGSNRRATRRIRAVSRACPRIPYISRKEPAGPFTHGVRVCFLTQRTQGPRSLFSRRERGGICSKRKTTNATRDGVARRHSRRVGCWVEGWSPMRNQECAALNGRTKGAQEADRWSVPMSIPKGPSAISSTGRRVRERPLRPCPIRCPCWSACIRGRECSAFAS